MKRHFNPYTMANTILMLRGRYHGSYLLLEGDTDSRFFSSYTNDTICKIIPAYGKQNVIDTLIELRKRGAKGVLGIVDADYWILEGYTPKDDLLMTDTHDLETMILVSPALEKVLKEFLPGDKINYIPQIGKEVRESLLSAGLPLGYLRWISYRERFNLDFDSLPFEQFVESKTLQVDTLRMIKSVRSVCRDKIPLKDNELQQKIVELSGQDADPWHICQGHDLVCILEIVLPVVLGKLVGREIAEYTKRKARSENLDRDLRVAYEAAYFVKTQLFISIQNWESANRPYKVLNL